MENLKYTNGIIRSLKLSKKLTTIYHLDYIGTELLLFGLLYLENCYSCQILNKYGVNKNNYAKNITSFERRAIAKNETYTTKAKAVIMSLEETANKCNVNFISTEHLLYALLDYPECKAIGFLRKMGVNIQSLKREVADKISLHAKTPIQKSSQISFMDIEHTELKTEKDESINNNKNQSSSENETKDENPLSAFGYYLTEKAEQGKLDPVIGRNQEITKIIQSLSRRTKNSPLLIGEAGVGKSAVAEGFALEIVAGTVPQSLQNKKLFSLDLCALLAGSEYRGQFEQKFKKALNYIQTEGDIILFIDEIHNIAGTGSTGNSNMDMAEMLKPMLARGEIQVIGSTTIDEYRKYIEKDPALARRFQPITINAPSVEDTIEIIKGLRDKYEAHHCVEITDDAIETAVKLSERYITDKNLPDKAIDLIDETASKAKLLALATPAIYNEKLNQMKQLDSEFAYARSYSDFEQMEKLQVEMETLRQTIQELRDKQLDKRSQTTPYITGDDVSEVLSEAINIPTNRIKQKDLDVLKNLENSLNKMVIGQENAVKAVATAIKRSRTMIQDPNKPIGSFIFVGSSGVGKTELCKALAYSLFNDTKSLITIDMSEYYDKSSLSKLIGAPPGFVGYDEPGQLTEKVLRKPYSVVLFDEIEKAHPDIFNLMLQILDEGRITDSKGKVINFKNTIIILTSNLGNSTANDLSFGFSNNNISHEKVKNDTFNALKKHFKPEFLNRVDEIIVFQKLNDEDNGKIAEILVNQLKERLAKNKIYINVYSSAIDVIIRKGSSDAYGARELKRTIQNCIEAMISDAIINGEIQQDDRIIIYANDNEILFKKVLKD